MSGGRYGKVLLSAGGAIVLVQLGSGVLIYYCFPDWTTRGQFGDIFGAVNALFSGLAFAGLIYAILLQREDLGLQREELKLTREELQRTANAQEQSEIALRAQADAAAQSARLNATNFLLEHYKSKLDGMRQGAFAVGDPRYSERQNLQTKERMLVQMLDEMFVELTTRENRR